MVDSHHLQNRKIAVSWHWLNQSLPNSALILYNLSNKMVDGRHHETAKPPHFCNNSTVFMKFSMMMHIDPLNHTELNEMLFAGQTCVHPKNC